MALFEGVSAFPPTPIDQDGVVAVDWLQRRVERLAAAGVDSIGLLGSTGAYPYLNRVQRRRAIEAAVEVARGRTPVMPGVGALRTDDACAFAADAAAAGADAVLLAPVSYTPLTEAEVFAHVKAVGEASDLPICLYNNPVTTRFTFGPDLITRLGALPTVRGAKMPAPVDGDFRAELSELASSGVRIGYSGDVTAAAALSAGAAAWYSVTAGTFPKLALSLARAAAAGDLAEVERAETMFQPLWEVLKRHGGVRTMSAAAGMLGLGDYPPPRPLLPLTGEDREALAGAVERLAALEATA
jgi:4-hydroxy-tetrahydrodipicolinate synthase